MIFKYLNQFFFREKTPEGSSVPMDVLTSEKKVRDAAKLWADHKQTILYIAEVIKYKNQEKGKEYLFDQGINDIAIFFEECKLDVDNMDEEKKDVEVKY